MRAWFWTLLLLALAVGLGVVLREHSGNVLIVAQPWRIEMSLTLFVLLLLATFVVLYLLFRGLSWLLSGPQRYREWRGLRGRKRDHELLESGWLHVLEGRYPQAEQELSRLLGRTRSANTRVLAGLALARACHQQAQFKRRDEALRLARKAVGADERLKESWVTAVAEMYLDQHRAQEALTLLLPYKGSGAKHLNATRLLLQAHRQLNNADEVFDLTRQLLRRNAIDKKRAMPLIAHAVAERLRAAGPDGFRTVWGELRAEEKTLPEVALAAAQVQQLAGREVEAGKTLEAALNEQLEPRLLNAYSQSPADQVSRRINRAEGWLKLYPDHSALLAALGNLCLIGQLWGSGERYLLRSMAIRSDVRIHALLGNLYDRLGRQADAMKHWRLASGVAGVLPVLPGNTVLPAADTRADPTLIDVQKLESGPDAETVPVAASAADYFAQDNEASDTPGKGTVQANTAQSKAQAGTGPDDLDPDYHQYFDSAPIPGIDLSKISDRSTRKD